MKIDRREALRLMAAGGAALGINAISPVQLLAATPDLAVVTGDNPAANVRAAIESLGGIKRFVSKGDRVVIKPNIGFATEPLRTSTTDPTVVRAIAELVLNAGAKQVLIFDNPVVKNADVVLETSKIKQEVKSLQDTFVYTVRRDSMFREVDIPKGIALKKQKIAKDILETDVLISVPVAKSHGATKVSFSMKGWMGVVQDRRFWHVWVDLNQAIADVATFIQPKLTVLDATRGLLTGGPGGPGKIVQLKTIVAGIDQVAVDAYGVTLAPWGGKGYKVEDVPHIVKAAKMGVGTYDLSKLNIVKKSA